MNYKVYTIPPFDRQLKRLAKKYPSLKQDFAALISSLEQKPRQGTSLGNDCYKVRMAIASKGKGKSGGARLITNVHISKSAVYLLTIYDKSQKADLTNSELKALLKVIPG